MDHKQHEKLMLRALRLAARGAGRVAPNPMVGALIVMDGEVIGAGCHKRFGGPHAEVEALRNCRRRGANPSGATMFVTLEPCCHHGKTPPCTEAIVKAGIIAVEIATLDDFKQVSGRGARWLTEQGIDVRVGCCESQARRLNAGFFKLQKTGQPQVILKWAQSIDGKLAFPAGADRRWITNEISRRHVHELRSRCGAILVGVGTVLADDPLLTVRLDKKINVPQPRRIVLDSRLRISAECQLVKTAAEFPLTVYTLPQSLDDQSEKRRTLENHGCRITAVPPSDDRLDLPAVLTDLGAQGVTDLLVEGGPTVLSSFLHQSLADQIAAWIAPIIIGESGNPPALNFLQTIQLHSPQTQHFNGDTLIEASIANTIKSPEGAPHH